MTGKFDDQATQDVVAALKVAGQPFMGVDAEGVEHPDQEGVDAALLAGGDTPSYVSEPESTANGIEVYLDYQGSIEPAAEETLRRILREELERLDLDLEVHAVVDPDADE